MIFVRPKEMKTVVLFQFQALYQVLHPFVVRRINSANNSLDRTLLGFLSKLATKFSSTIDGKRRRIQQ
jgi:hypothetical protein